MRHSGFVNHKKRAVAKMHAITMTVIGRAEIKLISASIAPFFGSTVITPAYSAAIYYVFRNIYVPCLRAEYDSVFVIVHYTYAPTTRVNPLRQQGIFDYVARSRDL